MSAAASSSSTSSSSSSLRLIEPDDFHIHLRDGDALATTVPAAARQFRRVIVMPNLKPAVTTANAAMAYRQRILDALAQHWSGSGSPPSFTPLMTLYLTDTTTVADIEAAKATGHIYAVKLYPAGATTHSAAGVTLSKLAALTPVFNAMAAAGLLLLVHGETPDADLDIFDREHHFLTNYLPALLAAAPTLRIVIEHITTAAGVEIIKQCPPRVAATVTVQHLLYNRNALLAGGLRPHNYCLPILKTEADRKALVDAVMNHNRVKTSDGSTVVKFFAGTDSAPHPKSSKESCCGAAGCYSANAAVEMYAEIFNKHGKLNELEPFLSRNGAEFYGLPQNDARITLTHKSSKIAASIKFGANDEVIPLRAGEDVEWTLEPRNNEQSKK